MSCNSCRNIKITINKLLKENSNLLLENTQNFSSKIKEDSLRNAVNPFIKEALEETTKTFLEQFKKEKTTNIKNLNVISEISDRFFKKSVESFYKNYEFDKSKIDNKTSLSDLDASLGVSVKRIIEVFYSFVPAIAFKTAINITSIQILKANKNEAVGLPRAANPTAFREIKIPILFKNKLLKEGIFSKALSHGDLEGVAKKIPTSPEDIRLGRNVDIDDFNRSIDDIKTKKVLPKAVESLNLLIRKISDRIGKLKQLGIDLEGIREKRLQEFKAKDKELYTERERLDSQIVKDPTTQARIKEIDVERSKLKTELDEFQNNINQRKKYFEEEQEALEKGKQDLEKVKEEVEARKTNKAEIDPKKSIAVTKIKDFLNSGTFLSLIAVEEISRRSAKFICSILGDEALLTYAAASYSSILSAVSVTTVGLIYREMQMMRYSKAGRAPDYGKSLVKKRIALATGIITGCAQGLHVDIATDVSERLERHGFAQEIDKATLSIGQDAGFSEEEIEQAYLMPTNNLWVELAYDSFAPFFDGTFGKIADSIIDKTSLTSGLRKILYVQLAKKDKFQFLATLIKKFELENQFEPTLKIYRTWLTQNGVTDVGDQDRFILCFIGDVLKKSLQDYFNKIEDNEELNKFIEYIKLWLKSNDAFPDDEDENFDDEKIKKLKLIFNKIILKIRQNMNIKPSNLTCDQINTKYGEQMKKFKNLVSKEDLSIRSTNPKETGNFCDDPKNDGKRVPGSEGFVCRKGIAVAPPQKPVQPQKSSGRDEERPEFNF